MCTMVRTSDIQMGGLADSTHSMLVGSDTPSRHTLVREPVKQDMPEWEGKSDR